MTNERRLCVLIDRDLVAWCDAEAFMVEAAGQRRFRLSIRTLMVAVALFALLLAPLVCTFRQIEAWRSELPRALAEERAAASAQAAFVAAKLGTADQAKSGSLWAGLSVNHPILRAGERKDLRIEFTLVYDGDKVIDPRIMETRIVINGKELTDSGMILRSERKGERFKALPPGVSLQFDCLLGDRFNEPAIYRVSWKGAGFQSSELVLRILPKEAH
jgi:hypothetical protein